ncbi:hypothetical protein HanPSC8_Chr13g0593141 [Helianthus annuus]|nr:hypothetical protein HanPSC8_Chr13g0593141 [Helianthus annuus]
MGRISSIYIFTSKCFTIKSMGISNGSNSECTKYLIKRKRNRKFESTPKTDEFE